MLERYDLRVLLEEIEEDAAKIERSSATHATQEEIRRIFEERQVHEDERLDEER